MVETLERKFMVYCDLHLFTQTKYNIFVRVSTRLISQNNLILTKKS